MTKNRIEPKRQKFARLEQALARGEADIAAGRFVVLSNATEIDAFFEELKSDRRDRGNR